MKLVLWTLVGPLQWIFFILANSVGALILPGVRRRISFERKNLKDPFSISFGVQKRRALVAFEVSSEGELEQVLPVIKGILGKGALVELIYCSPSVEKKCQELASHYAANLRILRLPLLSTVPLGPHSFSRWTTAKTLVLCRYDFFPEIMLFGGRAKVAFHLVSATVKNKEFSNPLLRLFWRSLLASFDSIVAATPEDRSRIVAELSIDAKKIEVYDFRIIQIAERLSSKEKAFSSRSFFPPFQKYLDSFPHERRIICGSFWPQEAALLAHPDLMKQVAAGEVQLTIVPHLLSPSHLQELLAALRAALAGKVPLHLFTNDGDGDGDGDGSEFFDRLPLSPGILVLPVRGILCELYSLFGHAYVGGGFGRSVHSVLEPFMAGAQVYLGPKFHRSTEYQLISSLAPQDVHVVSALGPENFHRSLSEGKGRSRGGSEMENLAGKGTIFFDNYLKRILEGSRVEEQGL